MDGTPRAHDEFQQRLLSALYKVAERGELILKGGVAMRVRAKSARYTRDIDLDHDPHRSLASLQHTVRRAIAMAAKGAGLRELTVSEPKQTQSVARWKLHAVTPEGAPIAVTIEVSRRKTPAKASSSGTPFQPEDSRVPRTLVDVYVEPVLLVHKLQALLDPNRVAPRDLYDLDVLLTRGNEPSASDIAAISNEYSDVAELIWRKLDLLNWREFRAEVNSALPEPERSRIGENEFDEMKLRVGERLAAWFGESSS